MIGEDTGVVTKMFVYCALEASVSSCKLDGGYLCHKQTHARTGEHDANQKGCAHSGSGLKIRMIEKTTKEITKVQIMMFGAFIRLRLRVRYFRDRYLRRRG